MGNAFGSLFPSGDVVFLWGASTDVGVGATVIGEVTSPTWLSSEDVFAWPSVFDAESVEAGLVVAGELLGLVVVLVGALSVAVATSSRRACKPCLANCSAHESAARNHTATTWRRMTARVLECG